MYIIKNNKNKKRVIYQSLVATLSIGFLYQIPLLRIIYINVLDKGNKVINGNLKSEISNAYSRFLKNVDELHQEKVNEYLNTFNNKIDATIYGFHPFCARNAGRHGVMGAASNEQSNNVSFKFKPVLLSSTHKKAWSTNFFNKEDKEEVDFNYIKNLLTDLAITDGLDQKYNAAVYDNPTIQFNCEDDENRRKFLEEKTGTFFGALGNQLAFTYLFNSSNNHNHFSNIDYEFFHISKEEYNKRERYHQPTTDANDDDTIQNDCVKNEIENYTKH